MPWVPAKAEGIFARAAGKQDFGNARFACSLFEQGYARMASRAAADGAVTVEELTTILPEDIDDHLSMFAKDLASHRVLSGSGLGLGPTSA